MNQPRQPYVSPAVNYQQALDAARADNPVGVAPVVPIPSFSNEMPEGVTLAQVAMMERQQQYAQQQQASGGIFGPQAQMPQPVQAQMPQIYPNDLLPEEAKQDPTFAAGAMGNMYAMHQPHLAMRYGVVRNGVRIHPYQLVGPAQQGNSRFRPDTLQGVQNLLAAQPNAGAQQSIPPTEQFNATGDTGAPALMANAPGDTSNEPPTEEEKEKVRKVLEGMDDLDLYQLRQMMVRDVLNNNEQRKIIEDRLEPLDITTLIMSNTISQVVPIIPGKFEPMFESVSIDTELALKAMIARESKTLDVTDQYYLDKYSLYALTAGLKAINKTYLPSYLNDNGLFDEHKFEERLKKVLRFPLPMMASLGVNYFWFDLRLRSLFAAVNVKNG